MKTKSKHRQGSWYVTLTPHIVGHRGPLGALTRIADCSGDISHGQANARLIASAPDLLEALIEVLEADRLTPGDCYDAAGNPNENWNRGGRAKAKARAAIAKATGGV